MIQNFSLATFEIFSNLEKAYSLKDSQKPTTLLEQQLFREKPYVFKTRKKMVLLKCYEQK